MQYHYLVLTLITATLPLGTGPLFGAALARSPATLAWLDGLVLAAILGLVPLHLLPEASEVLGLWAIPIAFLGLLIPSIAEEDFSYFSPASP